MSDRFGDLADILEDKVPASLKADQMFKELEARYAWHKNPTEWSLAFDAQLDQILLDWQTARRLLNTK